MGGDSAERLQRSGLEGRRIGRRIATPGLCLDWQPAAPQGRQRRRRRQAPSVQQAQLMDLSITGGRVVVADEVPIGIGTHVIIGLDGGVGTCRVRRAESTGSGETTYGIQFDWLDSELTEKVHDLVADNRRCVDEQWALDCSRALQA